MRCENCGRGDVPDGVFCTNCGARQGFTGSGVSKNRKSHYAPHPGEHVFQPGVFTTLFPHLGIRKVHEFRWVFLGGVIGVFALFFAGLITAALCVSVLLLPILYLLDVDGLHQAGGGRSVIELHGNLARVVCLDCGGTSSRTELHRRLAEANPDFQGEATAVNPDGDVDLDDGALADFATVDCVRCRRRHPEARRGLLRRDRARASGAGLFRPGGTGLRTAGTRLVADGHVGAPVRVAGGPARRPGRDRQSGRDPGDAKADLCLDAPLGRMLPDLVRTAIGVLLATGGLRPLRPSRATAETIASATCSSG